MVEIEPQPHRAQRRRIAAAAKLHGRVARLTCQLRPRLGVTAPQDALEARRRLHRQVPCGYFRVRGGRLVGGLRKHGRRKKNADETSGKPSQPVGKRLGLGRTVNHERRLSE
ncbi:MAG TPA: hypothetical protein EYP98_06045 [Planctomycetes bacterium]|nr:hypothetical protein [Planctomycetota bacterium]